MEIKRKEKKIKRKWEWIKGYCEHKGFHQSAGIAEQIDRVLYLRGGTK